MDGMPLAMSAELKRQGVGGVQHHPPIEKADLEKLYASFNVSDPESLQQKVFVDVMLYFGRRGHENLRQLSVQDFALTTDAEGLRYIYISRDEQTKNHQTDTNTANGCMYEIKGADEKCPVGLSWSTEECCSQEHVTFSREFSRLQLKMDTTSVCSALGIISWGI